MPLTYQQLQNYLKIYPDEIDIVQAFEALGSQSKKPHSVEISGSAWIIRPSDHTVLLLKNQLSSPWPLPQGELHSLYNTPETIKQIAKQSTQLRSDLTLVNNQIFHLSIQYKPTANDTKHHYLFDICMLFYIKEPFSTIDDGQQSYSWHNTADLLYNIRHNKKLTRLAKKWQWMSYQILETV